MKNTTNTIITLIVTAIVISIPYMAYQSLVAIPKQKIEAAAIQSQLEREAKAEAEEKRQADYNSCTDLAYRNYSNNWDQTCTLQKLEKDCTLAGYLSQPLEERHQQANDRCVALYK